VVVVGPAVVVVAGWSVVVVAALVEVVPGSVVGTESVVTGIVVPVVPGAVVVAPGPVVAVVDGGGPAVVVVCGRVVVVPGCGPVLVVTCAVVPVLARVVLVVDRRVLLWLVVVVVPRVVLVVPARPVVPVPTRVVLVVAPCPIVVVLTGAVLLLLDTVVDVTVPVVLVMARPPVPARSGLGPAEVALVVVNRLVVDEEVPPARKPFFPRVGSLVTGVAFGDRGSVVEPSLAVEWSFVVTEAGIVTAATGCAVVGGMGREAVEPPRPLWRRPSVCTVVAGWAVVVVLGRAGPVWWSFRPRRDNERRMAGRFPWEDVVPFGPLLAGAAVEVDLAAAVAGVSAPTRVVGAPLVVGANERLVVPAAAGGAALRLPRTS
jgi:hypothetical protein